MNVVLYGCLPANYGAVNSDVTPSRAKVAGMESSANGDVFHYYISCCQGMARVSVLSNHR